MSVYLNLNIYEQTLLAISEALRIAEDASRSAHAAMRERWTAARARERELIARQSIGFGRVIKNG